MAKNRKTNQPYRIIFLTDRPAFAFAGLYDTWTAPNGNKISTCTIITITPNSLMADIHDRMPVILDKENEDVWLDRDNQDIELLKSLLVSYNAKKMRAYKVSSVVGNVSNNGPELVEQII